MKIDTEIAYTFVKIMNDYAGLFKAGNNNVLVAIGRMHECLKENGFDVKCTETGYKLIIKKDGDIK